MCVPIFLIVLTAVSTGQTSEGLAGVINSLHTFGSLLSF